jgi:hypothetical protein
MCVCPRALYVPSCTVCAIVHCVCHRALCVYSCTVCAIVHCVCTHALCVYSCTVCVLMHCVCTHALCVPSCTVCAIVHCVIYIRRTLLPYTPGAPHGAGAAWAASGRAGAGGMEAGVWGSPHKLQRRFFLDIHILLT